MPTAHEVVDHLICRLGLGPVACEAHKAAVVIIEALLPGPADGDAVEIARRDDVLKLLMAERVMTPRAAKLVLIEDRWSDILHAVAWMLCAHAGNPGSSILEVQVERTDSAVDGGYGVEDGRRAFVHGAVAFRAGDLVVRTPLASLVLPRSKNAGSPPVRQAPIDLAETLLDGDGVPADIPVYFPRPVSVPAATVEPLAVDPTLAAALDAPVVLEMQLDHATGPRARTIALELPDEEAITDPLQIDHRLRTAGTQPDRCFRELDMPEGLKATQCLGQLVLPDSRGRLVYYRLVIASPVAGPGETRVFLYDGLDAGALTDALTTITADESQLDACRVRGNAAARRLAYWMTHCPDAAARLERLAALGSLAYLCSLLGPDRHAHLLDGLELRVDETP